jgi:thioester reductase-like protein
MAEDPHRTLYTFLEDGRRENAALTLGALDERARAIAAFLQARGTLGERALLVYHSGPEFVAALFGCFYAGVVAVPVAPPRGTVARRFRAIAAETQATIVLTTLGQVDNLRTRLGTGPQGNGPRVFTTDTVPGGLAANWSPFVPREEDPALIHFATRPGPAPAERIVSHRDLMHHSEAIRRVFRLNAQSVSVTWLPATHDMGLFDGMIQPIYAGFPAVVIPPQVFLNHPVRWLQAIARYRATHSGGPDFAYEQCVRRITPEERSALDLSSWRSAYNGAGALRRGRFKRFTTMFGPHGFQPALLHPCHGRALAIPSVSPHPGGENDANIPLRQREQAPGSIPPDTRTDSPPNSTPNTTPRWSRPLVLGSSHPTLLGAPGVLDLRAEALLDPQFQVAPGPFSNASEARSLFLTGATGFLGGFLLQDLLENTRAVIYCLVRASSDSDGRKRIERNLRALGAWDDRRAHRIVPIAGDLAKPNFELTPREFQSLAARTEVVYHAAGSLNWVYPYPALRAANVQATREVLKFAAIAKPKPFHYVSSLSVFDSPAYAGRTIAEADVANECETIYSGWAQSKWVAEQLVAAARGHGLPATIYRLPHLSGHSRTGVWDPGALYSRMIKGCIQLGALPELDTALDLAPVDFVSQAIGRLSRRSDAPGAVYHLNNPRPLDWESLRACLNEAGYPVATAPYREWAQRLGDEGRSSDNPLYPLMPLFLRRWSREELILPELHQRGRRAEFDGHTTTEALQGAPICPPADHDLLNGYLNRFIEAGYLNPPTRPS